MTTRRGLRVAGVVLVAVLGGCGGPASSGSIGPTPASSIIGAFVRQTDGKFGYEMLRPAGWVALDGKSIGRAYRDGRTPETSRFVLIVNNFAVTSQPDDGNVNAELFRRNPSLDRWSAALEAMMRANQQTLTLLELLPDAKVYASVGPMALHPSLVAFVVDGGQPLNVALSSIGDGAPGPVWLEQLRAEGVYADFVTMVRTVRAIPEDPANASPPLH